MCPLNCEIVKKAIKAHEERGIVMAEYIDYHKGSNALCAMCKNNEKANSVFKK